MSTDLWDIDAGYLSSLQLNDALKSLNGLLGVDKAAPGAALPARWRGHRDALVIRCNQVLAEMALRQLPVVSPLPMPEEAVLWPVSYSASPSAQLAEIRECNGRGQRGRISAPQSEHELWAQYKYSVLARNHEAYRHFGQLVAARGITRDELVLELVASTHVAPTLGGLRNAVYHMWGYVSAHSSRNPNQSDLATLMTEIQQLAAAHKVTYLLHSTALGELAIWCRHYSTQTGSGQGATGQTGASPSGTKPGRF